MLSIASNKACIWPIALSQWRMATFKKESSGNTHGTLHHSHHLFITVQKQKKYGKVTVWKTICNFFGSCVNRNPPQLIIDKMTWGKMLSNYPNFWINCCQKKNPQYMNWPPSWLYIMTKHISTLKTKWYISIEVRILGSTHITSRCYNKFSMHVYMCIPCQLIYTTDSVTSVYICVWIP